MCSYAGQCSLVVEYFIPVKYGSFINSFVVLRLYYDFRLFRGGLVHSIVLIFIPRFCMIPPNLMLKKSLISYACPLILFP